MNLRLSIMFPVVFLTTTLLVAQEAISPSMPEASVDKASKVIQVSSSESANSNSASDSATPKTGNTADANSTPSSVDEGSTQDKKDDTTTNASSDVPTNNTTSAQPEPSSSIVPTDPSMLPPPDSETLPSDPNATPSSQEEETTPVNSTESIEKKKAQIKARYYQVRTQIEKNEAVASLRAKANAATNDEEKRQLLRAYYELLFQKMKKEDPSIAERCDMMEAAYLRHLEQVCIEPTIPLNSSEGISATPTPTATPIIKKKN